MALHFGSLDQRCQWIDGVLYSASKEPTGKKKQPFHKVTTLEKFIDLMKDGNTCGNFLDAKDVNPTPPTWMTPLLDSTLAWNQTMHLRCIQTAKGKKKQDSAVNIDSQGPTSIRSGTWTSQGWRLLTHPGFFTFPHHDCCGMCTYVVGKSGAKIWGVIRPKRHICPDSIKGLSEVYQRVMDLTPEGSFKNADLATVCLESGDVMYVCLTVFVVLSNHMTRRFQPPGVLHCVYTPVSSIFTGGYFYSYETMHLTRAVLSMPSLEEQDSLTNDERPGFLRTLCRMLIALRYRSNTRKCSK